MLNKKNFCLAGSLAQMNQGGGWVTIQIRFVCSFEFRDIYMHFFTSLELFN